MITVLLLILFVLINSSDKLVNSEDPQENKENLPIQQRLVHSNQLNIPKLQQMFCRAFPSVGSKEKTANRKSYVFQRIALYLDVDDYLTFCQLNLAVGLTLRDYAETHAIPESVLRFFAEKNEKGFGLKGKFLLVKHDD